MKTEISKITNDDMIIRGRKLSDLIKENNHSDTIFLLLSKRNPTRTESKVFSALLISIIDHGMGTASSMTTRYVASTGNSMNTAIGAGVLALGDLHGGAIEKAMAQMSEVKDVPTYVKDALETKTLLYGFGHKVYKEKDPRTQAIVVVCKDLNYTSKFIDRAQAIETALKENGKKLCLNVDGVAAAILLGMGFPPSVGKGFFIIGRTPGLVAQAMEEQTEKQVRRVSEEDIEYTGKNPT